MDQLHVYLLYIIAKQQEENDALKARLEDLEEQVRLLKRDKFGQKSEKSKKRGGSKGNKQRKRSGASNRKASGVKRTGGESDPHDDPSASDEQNRDSGQGSKPEGSGSQHDESAHAQSASEERMVADSDAQSANDEEAESKKTSRYRGGGGRNKLPKHLKRVRAEHECNKDEKTCPHCKVEMSVVGETIVETLSVLPMLFYVIQNVYKIYRCRYCSQQKEQRHQRSILPRTQASPMLLAHIALSKLADALPLYRQQRQSERQECLISRDKMTRWLIALGVAVLPLVKLLRDQYEDHSVGWLDETRLQVIKEQDRTANQLSCLWTRYGGPPNQRVCLVDYRHYKNQTTVNDLMEHFSGSVVCDMFSCFHGLADARSDINLYGCHDHSRRRFDQAWEALPKKARAGSHADIILRLYDQLYAVESAIRGRSPRVIRRVRRRRGRKLLNQIYAYIATLSVRPSSKLGNAIEYMIKFRPELEAFLSNPHVPMSNILCEHIAKKIALARKNFLFCYSEKGAESMANLMTLVYTAMLYKRHNHFHYLTVVFTKLPHAQNIEQLEALLPWNLTPEQVALEMEKVPHPEELVPYLARAA